MKYLKVKNWNQFQHYKDRNPPWIKLSTDTFQDYEFSRLQDASKLLAVCIWTLASRYKDPKEGLVPADLDYIKSQCGLGDNVSACHLKELIEQGFIIDASILLADCKQDASPETETYSKETETKTEREAPLSFENLELSEEAINYAKANGVVGEHVKRSWKRFKIAKDFCTLDNWLKNWKLWIDDERFPDIKEGSDTLQGEELLAQQLGVVVWLRERKMFVTAKQEKDFERFCNETKITVTWRNAREWREQGSIKLCQ